MSTFWRCWALDPSKVLIRLVGTLIRSSYIVFTMNRVKTYVALVIIHTYDMRFPINAGLLPRRFRNESLYDPDTEHA